ncbi:MAG: putative Fimh-like protein [Methylococcaceae bacterium NSP1-2]|nr:DUF1566 domain-containing protein [Methylococcaceae bacterium]OYV16198.1 MAG: putative Fimh-like protein [Methylococcaceae bacterium NSP1-2]
MNDQARQLLLRLIRDYGIDLAHDPQRLNALFKDYAKGEFKREIFLCVQAAREGIVLDLQNNQHLPLDALFARLINQLQEDCGLDAHAASWTVETWLIALGLKHSLLIKKSISPAPLPPILPTQTPPATPVLIAVNNTSQINQFTKPQPVSLDDDLVLLIEDSLSWFKKRLGWQQHYVNNGDGTVTDSRTGLQWMRCSLGQYWNGRTCEGRAIEHSLQEALDAVQQLNNNRSLNYGYSDWRIPTWDELNSIRGSSSHVIDAKAFPNTPDSRFWTISESTHPDLTGSTGKRFYTVNFNRFNAHYSFGTALAYDTKYTRLVR